MAQVSTRTENRIANRLIRLMIPVSDMPKAKAFYAERLGLKVAQDYRQDDQHWWVSLTLPEGGVTLALTTYHDRITPGTATLYFETPDVAAAHKELSAKGVKVGEVRSGLYGPGSDVKFFTLEDPDGNLIHLVQA